MVGESVPGLENENSQSRNNAEITGTEEFVWADAQ